MPSIEIKGSKAHQFFEVMGKAMMKYSRPEKKLVGKKKKWVYRPDYKKGATL